MKITILAWLTENSLMPRGTSLSWGKKKKKLLEVIFISVSCVRQPAISCHPATVERHEGLLNWN